MVRSNAAAAVAVLSDQADESLRTWYMGTGVRITDERLALHNRQRFNGIFNRNLLPIVFWHQDGRVRDANDAFLKIIGYSRQELCDGKVRCDRITALEHVSRD